MRRRKTFRVIIEEKRLYAILVDAYGEHDAKDLARDIFQHKGFASGTMIELLDQSSCRIVGAHEKTKESSGHASI